MIALTKKELAEAAGYSYRRLHDVDRQLPDGRKLFVPCEGGKYDLAAFLRNWLEYRMSLRADVPEDFEEVKAQHERVKMLKSEIELNRMRGDMLDANDVERLWAHVARTLTQRLLYLPAKVAPQLVMMEDVEKIESIIDREVRDALTSIAETPLPGALGDEPEADDDDEAEE